MFDVPSAHTDTPTWVYGGPCHALPRGVIRMLTTTDGTIFAGFLDGPQIGTIGPHSQSGVSARFNACAALTALGFCII